MIVMIVVHLKEDFRCVVKNMSVDEAETNSSLSIIHVLSLFIRQS